MMKSKFSSFGSHRMDRSYLFVGLLMAGLWSLSLRARTAIYSKEM
jgi:hypothetical protein